MKVTVEISLYPLKDKFIPAIDDVIAGFKTHAGVFVETSYTATLLCGDYDVVMAALTVEIKRSFETYGHCVFVAKFIGRDVREPWDKETVGG